jgi:hypothetical protein
LFWTKITGGLIIGWPLGLIFILNSFLKTMIDDDDKLTHPDFDDRKYNWKIKNSFV